jgi:hypothetical protein
MAITVTHKDSLFTGSNATSYATPSYTPTSGRLLIASVVNVNNLGTPPATPTASGNGLTWSQVDTYLPDSAGTSTRITVFVALTGGSPSAGAFTADFGGETQLGCNIIVDEVGGDVDVSGTALDAIVQSVQGTVAGSGTSESIALAALSDANNASYGVFNIQLNEAMTAGSGYTITAQGGNAGPNMHTAAEYQVPGSTTVDISWTTSAAKGGIALEIKVAAGGNVTLVAEAGSFAMNGQPIHGFRVSMSCDHGSFS